MVTSIESRAHPQDLDGHLIYKTVVDPLPAATAVANLEVILFSLTVSGMIDGVIAFGAVKGQGDKGGLFQLAARAWNFTESGQDQDKGRLL